MASLPLTGSFQVLFLYDVCEEIRTEQLQSLIKGGRYGEGIERRRDPALLHPSPEYVRFERPPVVQQLGPLIFDGGERFTGELNYYDYGVVSLKLVQPFETDWTELVALSTKWIADSKLEVEAIETVRRCLEKALPALVRPNQDWLSEDYYIIYLNNQMGPDGLYRFTGAELIAQHGSDIARIVRGELTELSEEERREILGSPMSYYPEDLLVAGWAAAFLCDTRDGATPTVQLLEYANTQLLEFRYYDALLTRVLSVSTIHWMGAAVSSLGGAWCARHGI